MKLRDLLATCLIALLAILSGCGGGSSSGPLEGLRTALFGNKNLKVQSIIPSSWAISYGGGPSGFFSSPLDYEEYAYAIQETSDNGYIVAGSEESFSGGVKDVWILKLDQDGNVVWQNRYGGDGDDIAYSIQQTSDGGYIVAGCTSSFTQYEHAWILKLNANGDIEWGKAYGRSDSSTCVYSVQQTDDGYIAVGWIGFSSVGDGSTLIIKLDQSGNLVWEKVYGRDGGANSVIYAKAIQRTLDSGYIIAGYTFANQSPTNYDVWILKIDADGNKQWERFYGGAGEDYAYSIQQISNNEYVLAGMTTSFGAGNADAFVLKIDGNGNLIWFKTYGGTGYDSAYSLQKTSDGGYIVAGYTSSFGLAPPDLWIFKLNQDGDVLWGKTYGSSVGWTTEEGAYAVRETIDGHYIVAGYTKTFGKGNSYDMWILKVDSGGNVQGCSIMSASNIVVKTVTTDISLSGQSILEQNPVISSIVDTSNLAQVNPTYVQGYEVCFYPKYTLNINRMGTGIGSVSSDDLLIMCSPVMQDCTQQYRQNVLVTLQAYASNDSVFSGWGGDCQSCGTNTTCQITMDSNKTCTATFNQLPPNNPPVINSNSFVANPNSGTAPLQVTFSWNISDPDNDTLTCKLDVNGDNTIDYTINNCTSQSTQTHTYNTPGTYTAKLIVDDGRGGTASATYNITVSQATGGGSSGSGGGTGGGGTGGGGGGPIVIPPPETPTTPPADTATTSSPSGGNISVQVTGGTFTQQPTTITNIPAPPNNGTTPHGAITFTVQLAQGQTQINVSITFPSIPANAQFYKLINGNYIPFTPTISGNTISFTVVDNGQLDANSQAGVIGDPVVMVVPQQQSGGSGTGGSTVGGGGGGCSMGGGASPVNSLMWLLVPASVLLRRLRRR